MMKSFDADISILHDARVFGFLFDNNREKFKSDFYLYVQVFGEFNENRYFMRKSLVHFDNAKIIKLSIENDIDQGQYFITDVIIKSGLSGEYEFTVVFNAENIALKLEADDMCVIKSDKVESGSDQYLASNWESLLH